MLVSHLQLNSHKYIMSLSIYIIKMYRQCLKNIGSVYIYIYIYIYVKIQFS